MKLSNLFQTRLFRVVFCCLNIIVLMFLLIPALKLNVNIWWLDNLLNLQIQWSFLAIILMILNFFVIRKAVRISVVLYVTVIAYNLMPLYLPNPTQINMTTSDDQKPLQLTMAQLNLNYDNPNLKQLLPLLGDQHFDFLVLQEASDEEHKNIKELAMHYPYSLGIASNEATPSGMALFSRWPIIEKQVHDLGYKSGHLLEAVIQVPGEIPLQIYVLHPGSPRTEQLWQLRNKTLAITAEQVANSAIINKIIIGDFNSSPWSNSFRQLLINSELKNSANGFGYFPSWSYSNKPLLAILTSAYIDHSLVSKTINISNKQSLPIQGSDHLLLTTDLTLYY